MSVWDNRFWDMLEVWKRGLKVVFVVILLTASGGGVFLIFFAFFIALPAELIFGVDLTRYTEPVFIIGCATYGLFLVANASYVIYAALKKDEEQETVAGDKHGDSE